MKIIVVPERDYEARTQYSPRGMRRLYEMMFEYMPITDFNELAHLFHTYHLNNLDPHGNYHINPHPCYDFAPTDADAGDPAD